MKKLLVYIILIMNLSVYGQNKNSPTIVILNSQETFIPTELDSIAKSYVVKGLSEEAKENIRNENGEFKLKAEKEIEFLEEQDLTTSISYGLNYFLSYKFYEYFPDLLIYPSKEKNQSDLISLKKISEKHDVNWIVNLKKIEFIIENEQKSARIQFQLYNQKTNQMLIDDEFQVDDSSPGLEFTCENGTISCVINNSISKMSSAIISIMGKDKKYWR